MQRSIYQARNSFRSTTSQPMTMSSVNLDDPNEVRTCIRSLNVWLIISLRSTYHSQGKVRDPARWPRPIR